MHDDRIRLGDAIEVLERPPLRLHEVLTQDFEPSDRRLVLEDVCVVHGPEAEADAEMR